MLLHSSSSECVWCPCVVDLRSFVRIILDSIDVNATEEQRAMAYVYAFLAFLCTVLKVRPSLSSMSGAYNESQT